LKLLRGRTEHHDFFDRKGGQRVGVKAYQNQSFWDTIEQYLLLQEKYDEIYGFNGLPNLVEKDMAERFDSAIMKFAVTIKRMDEYNYKSYVKELSMRKEICVRGLEAMRKYVEDNKLYELPEIWVGDADGKTIGIIKEEDKLLYAKNKRSDIDCFYTMSEIMAMVRDYKMTTMIKEQLDKADIREAKVVDVQPKEDKDYFNDEVPF